MEYKKIKEASVFFKKTSIKLIECKSKRGFLLKNRIRIESARVRGSDKDGRDVFIADS